ncbi:polysaccharide deacetylase family protein [Novosphingobium cyanobacteriorum]|uniref:Polysaccharide deacetylase family protein n=1 Tax=Novosphingobium cyanobacteriorum TaxID=3024215 RepID=A0ABT6CKF6_9SPHN|nr:polysaccharide deacetylase family protein [Novosphingobium cyanobacteriorum]MDF8334387.1 polysaccharide deacetylase family protein [Novosphingobium cyanobacteriorum]
MGKPNILDVPANGDFVRFAEGFGPRFIVTVDTEEEFDWGKPFERTGHSLDHVPRLAKFQQFCEGFGVCPIYLIDYPVATDPQAVEAIGAAVAEGRAEIGVQLHPWVSPPHEEEVNIHNSFAGNLPPELERAKFRKLRDEIETAFGRPPLIYRAGRYGVGPSSGQMLADHSIAIDTSVRARFDYSSHGGPNFRDHPVRPWWIDRRQGLMELPLTTVFWGLLRQQGPLLYPAMWRVPRLRGALARAGLLERIPLTPEGVSVEEAIKGIDMALDEELPVLVFSFHSPSLRPGHTPYVRDEDELDALYDWWRTVFAYLARRKVRPTNVREIMAAAQI